MSSPNTDFQIKICGITRVVDAQAAIDAGADAIGLNFHGQSPRSIAIEQAAEISHTMAGKALCVGVFVNATADEIAEMALLASLDAVQLHGDEPPEYVAELPPQMLVIRAWRLGTDGLDPLIHYLKSAEDAGRAVDQVLIDARVEGQYGGTGATADWGLLADWRKSLPSRRLILAGGLMPENVAEAIRQVRPDAVDTASGVESAPGIKSQSAVEAFVASARVALEQ
jgi:phosphoribosylanthranilate isomerase